MYKTYMISLNVHDCGRMMDKAMQEINTNKERIVASHATEAMLIIITARS